MQFKPRFSGPIKNLCFVKVDHASCVTMDTHFVFDRTTTTALRSPKEPSAFTLNFGTINNEIPLVPLGAPGKRARTI
jgi:hypothetical protein